MDKSYTIREEIANAVTHGLGALFSILGLVILLLISIKEQSLISVITSAIYGSSLILLYTSSTLYHAFTGKKTKKVFQTIDHCSIFLLIAGTYTPFTLITLRGYIGYSLFAIVWIFALVGIALNIVDLKKYSKLSLICYVAMGWVVVLAIKPLYENLDPRGLSLLVAGGIFYTVGIIFYKMKKIKYMHAVWHLFVLSASISHFFAILFYVI